MELVIRAVDVAAAKGKSDPGLTEADGTGAAASYAPCMRSLPMRPPMSGVSWLHYVESRNALVLARSIFAKLHDCRNPIDTRINSA